MMKRYRITYFKSGDRPKPSHLIQLSKSGKYDGVRIWFREDGRKYWQDNWKNDLLNGIDKYYIGDSKNRSFINWKKQKRQGIQIKFK